MFSIRGSKFSNCLTCDLLDAPSCILETNCEEDLTKVDIIIVSENPGANEIETGIPLVGRAGKTFRIFFDKYLKNKVNYLITNSVLCQTIKEDDTVGNPKDRTINNCKQNLLAMIDICRPKLILTMGNSPMKALGIAKGGITDLRGSTFKFKDINVLVTVHPSFVNRLKSKKPEEFRKVIAEYESDIKKAAEMLSIDVSDIQILRDNTKKEDKGVYYYQIPEKYYTDSYYLVDVQYMRDFNRVLYIFRTKDGEKTYHTTNDQYYCYQCDTRKYENRYILDYNKLNQVFINYRDRRSLDSSITYEGDIKISDKHTIDYYLKTKGEADVKDLKVMYLDIETDLSGSREFPIPNEAKYPICLISIYYNQKLITYALNNSKREAIGRSVDDEEIIVFDKEIDLLRKFVKDFRCADIDVVTGWNVIGFDLTYIYNRLKNLRLNPNELSAFSSVELDTYNEHIQISGVVCLDMLRLYKEFAQEKRESNTLKSIGQLELGETKLELDESFSSIYINDINKFIKYNQKDVILLVKLDKKLKQIKLLNEIRMICGGSFKGCESTFGQLDNLLIKYLKQKKGEGSKNSNPSGIEQKLSGAYVKEPNVGIHEYIDDLDYTSLYPSLILTYNIGLNTFIAKITSQDDIYNLIYQQDNLSDEVELIMDPTYQCTAVRVKKADLIKKIKDEKLIYTINGCFYKTHSNEVSFYSEVLTELLQSRKEFKIMMFGAANDGDKDKEGLYDTRQWVFKILANALYGVLGNPSFRFFNIDLATSITLSGQEAIKTSIVYTNEYMNRLKDKAKNFNIDNVQLTKEEMFGRINNEDNIKNIITSDTDSLFITFEGFLSKDIKSNEDRAFEIMSDYCGKIQDYLNENVIVKVIRNHNVDIKYNRLSIKNELGIKRGLFLSKKHYALYVRYKEGHKVDKIISKGIEIRRSDYPSFTKQCLTELLDLILKPEKFSMFKVMDYINSKNPEFLKKIMEGDKTIARPASFAKKLEDYKILPENVVAMQNWNELMYNCFYTGSKGYLYKISGFDIDNASAEVVEKYNKYFLSKGKRINAICIPDEETRLPDLFIVDTKKMLNLVWHDRYNLMLKPLFTIQDEVMKLNF